MTLCAELIESRVSVSSEQAGSRATTLPAVGDDDREVTRFVVRIHGVTCDAHDAIRAVAISDGNQRRFPPRSHPRQALDRLGAELLYGAHEAQVTVSNESDPTKSRMSVASVLSMGRMCTIAPFDRRQNSLICGGPVSVSGIQCVSGSYHPDSMTELCPSNLDVFIPRMGQRSVG
jgi:hypothetical protein